MLFEILLSGSVFAAPFAAQHKIAAAVECPAAEIMMGAFKAQPVLPPEPPKSAPIPQRESEGRAPAVLLPKCEQEPPKKRRRRLSDYPMG